MRCGCAGCALDVYSPTKSPGAERRSPPICTLLAVVMVHADLTFSSLIAASFFSPSSPCTCSISPSRPRHRSLRLQSVLIRVRKDKRFWQ
jgi:hypothetical protein